MTREIRVAVCGMLPTAYDFLLRIGVVQIDQYMDATEIKDETDYHLILIYAPCAEGLLGTQYVRNAMFEPIPIRLLNEPCCHSALMELKSTIRRISKILSEEQTKTALDPSGSSSV